MSNDTGADKNRRQAGADLKELVRKSGSQAGRRWVRKGNPDPEDLKRFAKAFEE